MRTEWHLEFEIKGWQIILGATLLSFGFSILFHVWGDFGFHIVVGPFALIIDGPNVPKVQVVE